MRKNIVIIICMIMIFSITACGKVDKQEYKVLEAGGYDYVSDASHKEEIMGSFVSYKDESDKSSITMKVNGNDFSGEYLRTQVWYYYNGVIDFYNNVTEDTYVQIGINAETGDIVRYSYLDKNYLERVKGEKISEGECQKIAKEYLEKYVQTDNYEHVDTIYREIPEFEGVYEFYFVKIVDGIKTNERAMIFVTVYGDVCSHVFTLSGEMNDITPPSKEVRSDVEGAIKNKIDSIYNSVSDRYDYSYETKDIMYTRMKDGNYAFRYEIDVNLKTKDGENSFTERVVLFVYV